MITDGLVKMDRRAQQSVWYAANRMEMEVSGPTRSLKNDKKDLLGNKGFLRVEVAGSSMGDLSPQLRGSQAFDQFIYGTIVGEGAHL